MISIFYIIKKILEEMGNEKYELVYLKISKQTLENYEKWWNSYKSHNDSPMKAPVNNPCQIAKYFRFFKRSVESINTSSTKSILFPKFSKSKTKY